MSQLQACKSITPLPPPLLFREAEAPCIPPHHGTSCFSRTKHCLSLCCPTSRRGRGRGSNGRQHSQLGTSHEHQAIHLIQEYVCLLGVGGAHTVFACSLVKDRFSVSPHGHMLVDSVGLFLVPWSLWIAQFYHRLFHNTAWALSDIWLCTSASVSISWWKRK